MVNNYDRIYAEIEKEALRSSQEQNIDSDVLVRLVMEIVNLEDQHHTKNVSRIKQRIEQMILTTARDQMMREGL